MSVSAMVKDKGCSQAGGGVQCVCDRVVTGSVGQGHIGSQGGGGIFWKIPELPRMFWKIPKLSRMFQNIHEFSRIQHFLFPDWKEEWSREGLLASLVHLIYFWTYLG